MSECFGFETISFLLLFSLRMFEGIGGRGGAVLGGWVGESVNVGEKDWMKKQYE